MSEDRNMNVCIAFSVKIFCSMTERENNYFVPDVIERNGGSSNEIHFRKQMLPVKPLSFIIFFIACSLFSTGQDLHFSQWFNSPLTTNPANTGFIPDADYRIGANYRSQWVSVLNAPYKTMSIWGDAQVFRDRIENGWLGVGGVILHD